VNGRRLLLVIFLVLGSPAVAQPIGKPDRYSLKEDGAAIPPIQKGVLANDIGVGSSSLRAILILGPRHGRLRNGLSSAGTFEYRPDANFNGTDTFVYRAVDANGGSSPNVVVSLNVAPVNDAPVAVAATLDIKANVNTGIRLTGTDVDGNSLGFRITQPPGHGTVTGAAPVSYRPNLDFVGTDSFMFVATDGIAESAPVAISLEVKPVLTISGKSVVEGTASPFLDPEVLLTIRLAPAVTFPVNLEWCTTDGTAQGMVGPIDYQVVPCTPTQSLGGPAPLVIPAGQTTATISVLIRADGRCEPDETFFVHLTSQDAIVASQARMTIRNDDACP